MIRKYTAEFLESEFKQTAKARIRGKERGKQEYAGDAGYWSGGRCEWGGSHNLREDCQTLARLFEKLTDLKESKSKLTKFDNEQEFNSTKQKLITECQQTIGNLRQQNQYSYIGGVCIIWADYKNYVDDLIKGFTKTIDTLQRDINKATYNEAKELKALEVEEGQLKREIEENERKAANETDPTQRSRFLVLAEEAKGKWKQILERKKRLKIARLGEDFNPDEFIDNFVKSIKNKNNPHHRNPTFPGNVPGGGNAPAYPSSPNPLDPFQTTSPISQSPFPNHLLIFAILVLFLLFYSQSQTQPNYDYDF